MALISFYDWLVKQKNLRTALGQFARDATRDPAFPREVASLDAVLEYARAVPNSTPQNIAVARSSYRAYERAHGAPAARS
jgi:uncharacterized protein YozE (UPF0346 family)